MNSTSGIYRIYKDRFSNHRFDLYKDNSFYGIIFICHFLFRSCLRTREKCGARAFRPLQSSHYETIHLSYYNHNTLPECRNTPHNKGRRPFIARDGSRFHNGWGRMTLIIMVSVYSILALETLIFSLALRLARRGVEQGRSALENPRFINSASGISRVFKDRFLTFQHLPNLEGLSVYLKQDGQNIPKIS